ncbi:MAG: hypothetical protein J6P50_04040 [Bacteroidales bacterium]|nr:hypothetical protein [Bacteroidales bacterium]
MRRFLSVIILFCAVTFSASAQFTQNENITGGPPGQNVQTGVNPESDVLADTTSGFSVKAMVRGLMHKQPLKTGYALASNMVLPGVMQVYNKDYWKLPIIYGGLGSGIYFGIQNNRQYLATGNIDYAKISALCFAGAAAVYWGTLLDGVASFPTPDKPDPAKAAIYSALLPGLGQAYNGDWWHIPIWYGGLMVCAYTFRFNDMQYKRFRYIYNIANDRDSGYTGNISASQAKVYRDLYRRYRDYSVVATIVVYALNIIDANVFAHMSDFNVNDDLSFNVSPALIEPINSSFYASSTPVSYGLQMNLTF